MHTFLKRAEYERGENYAKKITPAAAFYFCVSNPFIDADEISDSVENTFLEKYKMTGIVSEQFKKDFVNCSESTVLNKSVSEKVFDKLTEFAMSKAAGFAEKILKGDITVSPFKSKTKDSCKFCAYKPICNFDGKYKNYKKLSNSELLEKIIQE
jgi:ATP-dependent helicase/nuclease subunit B